MRGAGDLYTRRNRRQAAIENAWGYASKMSSEDRNIDVCIVGGAGHVGLPLALVFAAQGLRVLIHDIDERALAGIEAGRMPHLEEGGDALLKEVLANGRLSLSHEPTSISAAKTVVITIGTPVDEFLNPVHKAVKHCMDGLLPHLRDGQLLVLRSTVFPGTTEWVARYLVDSGRSIEVAFCPERVVQGQTIRELRTMPQIVSGMTSAATAAATTLFGNIAPETIELTPAEAEFAKLFNNSFRYIQFAIANQFYMIANSAGVDYYRILDAMTRNYPRARGMPAAGFTAGPCLFKDTMQLAAFSRNQFGLGHAAMLVNEGLVLYIIDRLRARYPLGEMTVGLLGMAFKKDSDDIRASLSYKLKKDLSLYARAVLTTDPLVRNDPDIKPLDEVVAKSDLLIVCAPHSAYAQLATANKPTIDIWNYVPGGTHGL